MKNRDNVLLEQAYESIREGISSRRAKEIDAMHFKNQQAPISEDEANNLIPRFNMLPSFEKDKAMAKLKTLVGKEVALSKAVGHKQTSGYGRDDGSATVPGSGGSVAHTEFELENGVFAQGIIQDVKQSSGDRDYAKNGNLILTIKGQDYNVNQGATVKVKFLEDSPAEIHDAGRRSFHNL